MLETTRVTGLASKAALATTCLALLLTAFTTLSAEPASATHNSEAYHCRLSANTWCYLPVTRSDWHRVITGENGWNQGDTTTGDTGYWCSKFRDPSTGRDYGRECEWGRWTTVYASTAPPGTRLQPYSANGNNGSVQDITAEVYQRAH